AGLTQANPRRAVRTGAPRAKGSPTTSGGSIDGPFQDLTAIATPNPDAALVFYLPTRRTAGVQFRVEFRDERLL
ncbi:MAG: hypothetical protein PF443_13340, partial [Allgaiera sp.]|nr:hypothetical protein [Allgaiera sp.]